jgi:hypothetical protein
MPCRDYMDDQSAIDYARKDLQEKNTVLQKRLDNVTRLLCGVMHNIGDDATDEVLRNVGGLKNWWTEHQRLDALREAQERAAQERAAQERRERKRLKQEKQQQLKQAALQKLTAEEMRALGLG